MDRKSVGRTNYRNDFEQGAHLGGGGQGHVYKVRFLD